jgi:hypothetical protein
MSLSFHLRHLQEEIKVFPVLADHFLDSRAAHRLREATALIESAAQHPGESLTWSMPEDDPIRTIASSGEYEKKNDGSQEKGVSVVGLLSFKWHLRIAEKRPVGEVFLTGNATTKIRLINPEDESEISMWRMEIGAEDSPGCCFHTQILGATNDGPFPKWMPVPRLHSFPPTPMSCLEFLLSELFQRRWSEKVSRQNPQTRAWRGIQKERLGAFLRWQQDLVSETTSSSPLVRLKAFPDPNLTL